MYKLILFNIKNLDEFLSLEDLEETFQEIKNKNYIIDFLSREKNIDNIKSKLNIDSIYDKNKSIWVSLLERCKELNINLKEVVYFTDNEQELENIPKFEIIISFKDSPDKVVNLTTAIVKKDSFSDILFYL